MMATPSPSVELKSSPAAPEEAMDVKSTNFEDNVWYKKYQLLKRKCSEFEQLNDILFSRAKKIHLMIENAEAEKRSLMKRLEQFEVVEFPRTRLRDIERSPDNLSELDSTLPTTAARVRRELEASKATTTEALHPTDRPPSVKVVAPPPLVGRDSNGLQAPTKPISLRPPSAAISPSPVSMATPSVVGGATSVSVPAGRGKKWTKRDSGTVQRGSSKKRKGDADPNAPKKPSNAFFWFCQDKRAALQEQVKVEGLGGQHDLTKALARLWSETKTEDKRIYYEKYATDKARYDKEMEDYHRSKHALTMAAAGASDGRLPAAAHGLGTQRVPPLLLQLKVEDGATVEP